MKDSGWELETRSSLQLGGRELPFQFVLKLSQSQTRGWPGLNWTDTPKQWVVKLRPHLTNACFKLAMVMAVFLGKHSQLGSVWHSQWTFKEIKLHKVHSVALEEIVTTSWSGSKLKFESKFEALLVVWQVWQSLLRSIPEGDRRFWLQNHLLPLCSSSWVQLSLGVRTGKHIGYFQVGCSRCRLLPAYFTKKCRCNSRHTGLLILGFVCDDCMVFPSKIEIFMIFAKKCNRPKPCSSPDFIIRSFIVLSVKMRQWNNSTCSTDIYDTSPVQSSRARSMTVHVQGPVPNWREQSLQKVVS